jgi:hypothetical protein
MHAASHAFNYSLLGRLGFELNAALVDACDCWDFRYSQLDERCAASRTWCDERGLGHLLQALRTPGDGGAGRRRWDLLLRQAASAGLLGRLAALAQAAGIDVRAAVTGAPAHVRRADHRRTAAARGALGTGPARPGARPAGGPVLLLKGAAYAAAGLPPAAGRLFSDIDLMVPKAQIATAEALLTFDGWVGSHHSAYDQRYYRQWMHELPPMTHIRRRTVLDLHHNILPRPRASRRGPT